MIGNYSVSIISGVCTSSVSNIVLVNVTEQPLRPTANNTGPACVGQSITLEGSSSQSGLTFYWQGPNNFVASGPSTMINANSLMAGVYSLVVFNAGGCTSEVATTVVQVNTAGQTPPTLSQNAPLCEGQTLRLTATGLPFGTVYTVTGPNGYSTSGVGPEFTRLATTLADGGVYNFQYNVGCGNQSATINITISPKPLNITASSNSPLCVNNTLNLTASNSTPGAGYFWTGPDNFSYMAQSVWRGGMNAQRAGVYSVVAVLGNCTSDVATTSVEVYSLPQPLTLTSNATICTGGTLFLTTNGPAAATYTFSGPGFSQTTAANFTSRPFMPSNGAGTYSVNVSLGSCTGAATTPVSLLPGPELTGLISNSPVCLGKNLTLTATASGSGTISYRWQGPNNYSFVTGANVHNIAIQSAAQAGTYSVSAIMGTCTTSARTVDVSVLQYTITASNDGPKCLGENFVFSSTSIPGATYYWNTPDGVTVSFASPDYTRPITASNQAGGYTVYAVIGSCTSNTASTIAVLQTLNLNPQITGARLICEGSALTLTASNVPTNGYSYFWVAPGGVIAPEGLTFTKMNATTADAGVYKLIAQQGACEAVIAQTDVIVTPPIAAPIASNDGPVCAGGMIKLAASDIRGASYYWRGPNGFMSAQQNPVLNPAVNGIYSVAAIVGNCTSVFATTEVQTVATPDMPTISGNSPVCEGGKLILNAGPVSSGAGYYWTGPNGFTSTLQSPIIFNAQISNSGPYQVVATLGNCSSASALVSISVIRVNNPVVASNNGPACAGQKVTLSVPFLSWVGYHWQGPNGFSSADREPEITNPAPGFYSVSYTTQGCTSSTPAVTEVKLVTPTSIAAGNNGPVCLGAALQLTASSILGASYLWQGPNGYTSSQQNPMIASFNNPGTYSVTIKVGSCDFGTATTTADHFSAVPASSASSSSPCVGGTLYLTASTVAGATYYWTGPNGFSRNTQNVEITNVSAAQSGVYTLVAIIGNCTSAFSTTQVNVTSFNPPAWASNNGPQCAGQPVTLFAPAAPLGYGYYWSGPNGFSATQQNPVVNFTGEYSLAYTANGCTSQVARTQVTIINAQTIVASNGGPYCSGQVIQLNATLVSGAVYKWSGPNNFSSSLANPTIPNASGIHQGTYTVEVRISGCTQIATTNVTVISSAISNVTAQSNSPVCVGGAIQLTANATGSGLSYYWRGPNNFQSQQQNPVIGNGQTLNAGVYSVSVIANGCTSSPALVNVRVTEVTGSLTAQNNGPLCNGATLLLTASGIAGANYQWAGPGFSSASQNPALGGFGPSNAGIYTVTATFSGCTLQATTEAQLSNVAPPAPLVGSNSPVCFGATLQLTASVSSGNATYSWSGPASFASTLQNPARPNFGSNFAGNYSVVAIVNSCSSAPAIVAVALTTSLPMPMAAANKTILCEGEALNLSASGSGNVIYNWVGPNNARYSGANVNIPNATTWHGGAYQVTAIAGNCTSQAASIAIQVIPFSGTLTASGNSPVCAGDAINLTATSTIPNVSYSWSGPSGFSANTAAATRLQAQTTHSGTYEVTVTSGVCSRKAGVAVTVQPNYNIVISGNPVICQGQTLSLSATAVPGATYTWRRNGIAFANGNPLTLPNAAPSQSGSYAVEILGGQGCVTNVAVVQVTINADPGNVVITSNAPICEGQRLTLNASGNPNAQYVWSGPNNFSATGASVGIVFTTSAHSGQYTVSVSAPGCPTTVVAQKDISVHPKPALSPILSNTPICAGSTLRLTGSEIPSASYRWSGPNNFSRTDRQVSIESVNTAHSGVYSLIAWIGQCTTQVETVNVNVLPALAEPEVIIGNNSYCEGQTINLTASYPIEVDRFIWKLPDGSSQSGFSLTVPNANINHDGIYSVAAVVGNCTSAFGLKRVIVSNPDAAAENTVVSLCGGSAKTIPIYFTGRGPWTLEYNDGTNVQNMVYLQNPGILTLVGVNSPTTTYTLQKVTDFVGCSKTLSQQILVKNTPTPSATYSVTNQTVCRGAYVDINTMLIGTAPWVIYTRRNGVNQPPQTIGASGSPSPFFYTETILATQNQTFEIYKVTDLSDCVNESRTALSINVTGCAEQCPAPTNLGVKILGNNSAQLNWVHNPTSVPSCYVVAVAPVANPTAWVYYTVPYPATGYWVENLIPGQNYLVQVRSNCSSCAATNGSLSYFPLETTLNMPTRLAQAENAMQAFLYPNPNNGNFQLAFQNASIDWADWELLEIGGRTLKAGRFEQIEPNQLYNFHFPDLPGGIYLFKVRTQEGVSVIKLQIE